MQALENQLKITYLEWIDRHLLPPTQAELCEALSLSAAEFEAYFGAVARIDSQIWQDIVHYTLLLTAQHTDFALCSAKQQTHILFSYLLELLKKHQNFVRLSLQTHGLVDVFPKPIWLCVLEAKKQLEYWVSQHIDKQFLATHPVLKGFSLSQLVGLQLGIVLEKFLDDDGTDNFLLTQTCIEGCINFTFRTTQTPETTV